MMENSQSDSNIFSVRIVSMDYYMAPPITDVDICYSSFQGEKVKEVPVIRIYGSTPAGQKTCLHVHRALPYLYVPCSHLLQTSEEGEMHTRVISSAIEKALKSKLKSSAGSKRQHVHGCSLVRARKFYGFHPSEELFVKIYLYYPHEVTRVATLLLDGAVLDRSYQPHESHIPYLLQFLVDYNLYGMGHLHVSKVKFRYPLPDSSSSRVVHQSGASKHTLEKIACTSGNDQAGSSSHSSLGLPVWISTTVPSGWMWPPPIAIDSDSSPDQDTHLIKRQSTCELEGDVTVDDIVNQQFKMYSPLSQTRSEVKMVQSLVPIWEEEYERTGMHEEVVYFEASKPLPQDVLRTLSHGPEYENAFIDLCKDAENSSPLQVTPTEEGERFMQSIRSLADVSSSLEMVEHANASCSGRGSSQCSEERNGNRSISSQDSLTKQDDDAVPSQLRLRFPEIVPVTEEMTSLINCDPKGMDTEAIGLLRWLASSQAEEELNTDDELGYDLILTPLLPKTGIDKMLEKANMDYECESQQECQDILDSVVDPNSSVLKEQNLHSTSASLSTHMSSGNIIPQVDGSCDDPVTGCAGNLSEIDPKDETVRSSHRVLRGKNVGLSSEKKKNHRLWGPLPLSTQQKVGENSDSFSFNSDVSNDKNSNSSLSGKRENESWDKSITCNDIDDHCLKEQKELSRSSVRDLMRKKRCCRVEPSEVATCGVKKICLEKQQEAFMNPRQLEFHVGNCDVEDFLPNRTPEKPPVIYQTETASERNLSSTTCERGTCPKAYGFGAAYGDVPVQKKVPLMPRSDSSMGCGRSKNEHLISHEWLDNITASGVNSRSESIPLTDVPLLQPETKELVNSLVSVKPDSALGTGQPECCEGEKSELFARCPTPSDENNLDSSSAGKESPDTCSDGRRNTDAAAKSELSEMESSSIPLNVQSCSSSPIMPTTVTTQGVHAKYTQMSFSKKPPIIDGNSWMSADTSFAPFLHDQTSMSMDSSEGTFGCNSSSLDSEGSVPDEIPPFFPDIVQVGEEVYKSYRNNEVTRSSHVAGLGIPTHYKNDGSLLYLLTPMYSPPSGNSVHDWLFHHPSRYGATGARVEQIRQKSLDSRSSSSCRSLTFPKKNTSDDGKAASEAHKLHALSTRESNKMCLQESIVNCSHGTLLDSGTVLHKESSRNQLTEKINTSLNAGKNHPEVTTIIFTESTVPKGTEQIDNWRDVSQISGPDVRPKLTPLSQSGFRDPASTGDGQQLTLMSVEVQAESRGDLRPDPRLDAITVIAVTIQDDNEDILESFVLLRASEGESNKRNLDAVSGCTVIVASEEKHLFYHFLKIVRSSDPDILMGWEIQGGSLGFLAERAAQLGIVLLNSISRTPSCEPKDPTTDSASQETGLRDDLLPEALITDPTVFEDAIIEDEWGRTHASGVHVGGRIVLNIWRLMRSEIKLNMYTLEAVAEEVLRRKVPLIPPRILTQWFLSGPGQARFRCIEYILERTKLNLEIMNQLDMINRTSELARVFGIDFFSVLSRGSQYRVESMFLRLAHTQNYLAVSPGNQQVASQPAMECLPLVMEPESGFYADPVVVLDFQSLYPSMIIAYNLCYSTCLGKVTPAMPNTLGVSSFIPDAQLLMDQRDKIMLSPNGVMYVPTEVRKGVLPRLLEEILSTRIMVKRAMKKLTPSERVLHKIFNARQLALKLISNVTYGYTAAGFSGRMPCAELADSIVQCGRRTLENAISFVNSHDKWNAKVIYGDTDSMFVLLKGRTMEESFSIGQEIASVITSMNPSPVTLKMEKVYHPCFLLTKKRYVGYSYEHLDQAAPLFDAKGIETVRRDSCGAVAKTLEQSLRLFFEYQDISKIKLYLQRQWTRILVGRVSIQDFVFAKEVRLGTYSARASSLPPAAIVAGKAMKADPRAEPHYAERIPYVVIHGEPGARLVDMVVDPLDLLAVESPFRLNDLYYINKQIIPALQRVFGLVGADLRQWFLEMPRAVRPSVGKRFSYASNGQRTRIDSYYLSKHCVLCGELVQASNHLCDMCSKKEPVVATAVISRTSAMEKDIQHLAAICRHCGGGDWVVESAVKCISLACTLFYQRRKVQKELQAHSVVATDLGLYPRCRVEWF